MNTMQTPRMLRSARAAGTGLFLLWIITGASFAANIQNEAGQKKPSGEPQRQVLKAGTVLLEPGKSIPRGVVIIENGKITAVGTDLGVPVGAQVTDFGTAVISAGIVDSQSQRSVEGDTTDTTFSMTPAVRVADAVRENATNARIAAELGVTTSALAPTGDNVVGGIGCIVKNAGPGRMVREEAFLKLSFSNKAFDSDRFPATFPTAHAQLRKIIGAAGSDPAKTTSRELKPFARMKSDLRPWIEVDSPIAVRRALAFAKEFALKPVLVVDGDIRGAVEEIAAAQVPVVLPTMGIAASPAAYHLLEAIAKAGVEFAFATGIGGGSAGGAELRRSAAAAAILGISTTKAHASITTVPARLLGAEGVVGRIEAGRDADLMVTSGDPLSLQSRILGVYIRGALIRPEGSRR